MKYRDVLHTDDDVSGFVVLAWLSSLICIRFSLAILLAVFCTFIVGGFVSGCG